MKNKVFFSGNELILLIMLMLNFVACEKKEENNPPQIPPQSSMVIDFSNFQQDTTQKGMNTDTYRNWVFSALNVAWWNFALTVTLAVPVASYLESFNHEPVEISQHEWKWPYTVTAANVTYSAELHGIKTDTGVVWKMYISRAGGFQNFLWFEGFSDTGLTQGTWTLYNNPFSQTTFIGIVWHKNHDGTIADIKYTNIIPNDPNNGGYILYGINNLEPYNAYYNIYGVVNNNLIEIEWNRATKNGRVKNPAFFVDQLWHCWDETLKDIDCE